MKLIKISFFALLWAFCHASYALKSDSDQPVTIDSNTASFNNKTQISIYTGNVVTQQGSLYITSDKLVVYLKKGEVDKMVFTGKPAKFKQLPRADKDYIHGKGLTGEYYPKQDTLILIEQAVVSQGENRSESHRITYNSKNSLIKAGSESSDLARVHSVFKSKTKKDKKPPKQISKRPSA